MSTLKTCVRTIACAILVSLGFTTDSVALTKEEVQLRCKVENRPCVGLVLSGGGARGFAHVGVIKELEKLGIIVDVVTGTSMGSMVGGAYAAGYPVEQLENTVVEVNWDKMLASRPDRAYLPWTRKVDDYKSLANSGVELNAQGIPQLPASFVPNEELALFLNNKTGFVDNIRNLRNLPLPFAAVATNLVTGQKVVMQEDCTLGQAMRASMSVPGAFAPEKFHGQLLVDGGLTDNLPVDLARQLGADVVIAVNVGTPLSSKEELGSVFGVMTQMINILTEQNVQASIKSLHPADILITPDLSGVSSTDLQNSRAIIAQGEKAAQQVEKQLKKLSVSPALWQQWNHQRIRYFSNHTNVEQKYERIAVANKDLGRLSKERVIDISGLPPEGEKTRAQLDNAVRRVWATGLFEQVTYRFAPGPDGTEILVLEPIEKKQGYSSIHLGGSLETDFNRNSNFNLLFSHQWNQINAIGGTWTNEIQIGETQSFSTEFLQPFGSRDQFFVRPSISYVRTPFDVYKQGIAVSRERNSEFRTDLEIGTVIGSLGYASVSAGYLDTSTTRQIGLASDLDNSYQTPYLGMKLLLDTLDNINFPTSGFRVSFAGNLLAKEPENTKGQETYFLDVLLPYSVGRWSAQVNLQLGASSLPNYFMLGGARRMVGAPYGRWTGSRLEYGRLGLARNISDYLEKTGFRAPVWLGVNAEIGRAWNPQYISANLDEFNKKWNQSYSVYIGVDSLIGPLMLTVGNNSAEGTGVFFLWGYRN